MINCLSDLCQLGLTVAVFPKDISETIHHFFKSALVQTRCSCALWLTVTLAALIVQLHHGHPTYEHMVN